MRLFNENYIGVFENIIHICYYSKIAVYLRHVLMKYSNMVDFARESTIPIPSNLRFYVTSQCNTHIVRQIEGICDFIVFGVFRSVPS